MEFKLGELFHGPGGCALGATMAKVISDDIEYTVTHEWSNDYDEDTCRTYRHNICPDSPDSVIHGDVRELNLEQLGDIDAFIYGFPCNDFSLVGEKKGFNGTYGPLYTYGIEVLKLHRPKWFIAENVGGLQSANDGQAFIQILKDMTAAGYRLTPHLYNFADYGVPQARQRIIIVGLRNDLNIEYKVPAPTHGPGRLYPYRTASEAILEPPIPPDAFNHEFTRHTQKVINMLNHIPAGENAWYDGIPENLKLNVVGARMSQIYRRLHPDLPSYTVTGSGGGGTHMYHWNEARALTNRERARLQTFPDDFIFLGGKESVRKQVGMAVPPLGAKIIVESILKTYASVQYESIDSKWNIDKLLNEDTFKELVIV